MPVPIEYEISYAQTPEERYDTDMNERVRKFISDAGYEVVGEAGGTMLGNDDMSAMTADCQYSFMSDLASAIELADKVEGYISRPVKLYTMEGDSAYEEIPRGSG